MATVDAAKRRKSEVTRERLVAAAHTVFNAMPYSRVRVVDICQEAGNASGVFYRYFLNKEDIFAACVEQFQEDLRTLSPKPEDFDRDLIAAVRKTTEVYWETYFRYRGVMNGLFQTWSTDPRINQIWRQMHIRGTRQFAHRIRCQQSIGRCQNLDADIAASAILYMFEFSCHQWTMNAENGLPGTVPSEDAIRNLFELIKNIMEL